LAFGIAGRDVARVTEALPALFLAWQRSDNSLSQRPLGSALIGKQNVAGPTLNSLGGDFGLAPLIGRPLAIISDARFVGKNSNIVVERLLSISGEDTLTVNRKYRDQWTGKLRIGVERRQIACGLRRMGRPARRPQPERQAQRYL
jgi:hypothetical protein